MAHLTLPAAARRAFDRMAGDLQRVFTARFVALVASGPRASVAFSTSLGAADLDAIGPLVGAWHRDGLDTPLLLTPEEFRRSLDAFPLEYQTIADRHAVIAGHPPFDDLVVDPALLRRACEAQAKSHLIHLRQGWLDAVGHDDELAELLARSSPALRALLTNMGRLLGAAHDGADAPLAGARLSGLDVALVQEVLALEDAPEHGRHLVRRLPEYLATVERLCAFVDAWTP